MSKNRHSKLMAIRQFVYNSEKDTFDDHFSCISVQQTEFESGGMRNAYFGYRHFDFKNVVIKRYQNGQYEFPTVANDVKMQLRCQILASEYNKHAVATKKVEFVDAVAIQFIGGPWEDEYAIMEDYLDGVYIKHNLNMGRHGIFQLTNRNTPQAFSHFTYHFTNGKELVCDIQGVEDRFTDPQIHTVDQLQVYGQGNFGIEGIQYFKEHHVCSQMCVALNLTPTCSETSIIDTGTVPNYFALRLEYFRKKKASLT